MNGEAWPDLKYRAVSRFIGLQVRRFGSGLPEEECSAEAWRAYLEASREYRRVAGCCDFSDFAAFCIRDSLDTMRRRRSERIALESSLSLDDVPDGGREPFGLRYFPTTGDFSPCVVLWEFVRGLGEEKDRLVRGLYRRMPDEEIMEEQGLAPERYYALLQELQEDFSDWEMISR